MQTTSAPRSAFSFDGTWRDYAPIAFTNLLLMIVTLGIYRFWAKTRERRYLWAHTRFIDDRLEWTGTGKELFIGFVLVLLVIGVPMLLLQLGIQALIARDQALFAGLLGILFYLAILFLFGLARFRALRYRLSRTVWHGISGGSDDQGFDYAVQATWMPIVGGFALGLLIPWSLVGLWNEKWARMSFGPHNFTSGASAWPVFKRMMICVALAIPAMIAVAALSGATAMAVGSIVPDSALAALFAILPIFYVLVFIVFPITFYAVFYRECIGHLTLGHLGFGFDARTRDWIKLYLGDVALVVCTLGIGAIFLGYRHWSFFIRHLEAYGEVDLDTLTVSTTRRPGQGEGLLDAFDIGAV
ncbi:YjgN family protein [Sphingomonas sp. RS2018]